MTDAKGDDYTICLVDDLASRFTRVYGWRIDDDDVGKLWQMGFKHPLHGWRLKKRASIGDLHPAGWDNVKPWDARFMNGIRWTGKVSDEHFDKTRGDAHAGVCEEFVELWMAQVSIDEEDRFALTNGSAGKACSDTGAAFGTFCGCHSKRDAARHPPCDFIVELVVCGSNGPDAMTCRCDVS